MLERNKQEISDIKDSNILQAERDINIMLVGDNTLKDIIYKVVRAELNIVTKEAYEKFNHMIEEFRSRLLEEIAKMGNQEEVFNKFKEPKYQFILHDAVKEYAQSKSNTLKSDLIDILIDRLQDNETSVMQFIIEEAIHVLPKLTLPLSHVLGVMYIRFLKERCTANLLQTKFNSYAALFEDLGDITNLDIEYLKQLNCCSSLLDLKHMEPIETEMRVKYDLFFRKPATRENFQEYKEQCSISNNINISSYFFEYNDNRYKCLFLDTDSLKNYMHKLGKEDEILAVTSFVRTIPVLTDGEIRQELISINPNWEKVINLFHQEFIWNYQPTPVGMYIARKVLDRTDIRLGDFDLKKMY